MPAPLPPSCAARFRPESELAAGGFGVVYRAVQLSTGRPVVVKVLLSTALEDPALIARFRQEAKVTAAVPHPNVVRVVDHDVDEGVPWIAYELVTGGSLKDALAAGPLPWAAAVRHALDVAAALEHVHASGVLHRDIKPANLLLDETGACKVTDFGIARWDGRSEVRTQTGVVFGSPGYMAPEVLAGNPATPASDVYALAVTLYELIAGQQPYEADGLVDLISKQRAREVPSLAERGAPPPLDRVLYRALAPVPEQRHQRAKDFADALAPLVSDAGSSSATRSHAPPATRPGDPNRTRAIAAPPPARPAAPVALVAAALAAGALALGIAGLTGQNSAVTPASPSPTAPASVAPTALSTAVAAWENWKLLVGHEARLRAGGPKAAEIIARLRKRPGMLDLGSVSDTWALWAETGRWLENPSDRLPVLPPRLEAANYNLFPSQRGRPTEEKFGIALRFISDDTRHPTAWLELVAVLDEAGLDREARSLEAGAARLALRWLDEHKGESLPRGRTETWTALARGLRAIGRAPEDVWHQFVGEGNALQVWSGLRALLPGDDPRFRSAVERALADPRRGEATATGAARVMTLYDWQRREAIALLERAIAQHPKWHSARVELAALLIEELSLEKARVAATAAQDGWQLQRIDLVEGTLPLLPIAQIRIPICHATLVHRHLERGETDAARAAALHCERTCRLTDDEHIPMLGTLLGTGAATEAQKMLIARAMVPGVMESDEMVRLVLMDTKDELPGLVARAGGRARWIPMFEMVRASRKGDHAAAFHALAGIRFLNREVSNMGYRIVLARPFIHAPPGGPVLPAAVEALRAASFQEHDTLGAFADAVARGDVPVARAAAGSQLAARPMSPLSVELAVWLARHAPPADRPRAIEHARRVGRLQGWGLTYVRALELPPASGN
jgi:hypothetical protein